MIYLFNTFISSSAILNVSNILNSTFLSEGKIVASFEDRLARDLGLFNAVTVNSGTSALHLALILSRLGSDDEVICPAQTFVASATAILQANAVPVFADIQYETGNLCPRSVEEKISHHTRAIMPVHWGGYPCDLEEIHTIARNIT